VSPRVRVLTTTLALLAVALAYTLNRDRVHAPPRPARGSAIERPAPPPAPPPSAREILDRRVPLGLSREQAARLEALDRQWQEESATLQAAIAKAEKAFAAFMQEAQARRATLQEIQRQSAEVARLSAFLREGRLLHGEAATAVLSQAQRRGVGPATSLDVQGGTR